MVLFDEDDFCEPLSPEASCGPDLDAAFDLDFTGFFARIEGLLPMSFFTFRRSDINFAEELEVIRGLSRRTRDLRLLVAYGKLGVLSRDLDAFANAMAVIVRALVARWDDVHPQAEDGRFDLRAATLMALDDLPQVVLPLQHLALIETRRWGVITYRSVQIAGGKVTPREDEATLEAESIDRAFGEADLPAVRERSARFHAVLEAAERIDAATVEAAGHEGRVDLIRLKAAAKEIAAYLDGQIARIDPAAPAVAAPEAQAEEALTASGVPAGTGAAAVASRAEAEAELRAAEAYFERWEPSSPALLVVGFARRLMGKPFVEVLRQIAPDQADYAEIRFGANAFRLTLERLNAPRDDGGWGTPAPDAEIQDGEGPLVETRDHALRLLDQVAAFLRVAEPSNPVPLLLARARDLAGRDFSALLKDIFSDAVLRAMKGDE